METISLGLDFLQKIPTGGSFSASINQSIFLDMLEKELYVYEASGKLNFSQPIFFSLYGLKNELKQNFHLGSNIRLAAESRWKAFKLKRAAETLSLMLDTVILLERQKCRENIIKWYEISLKKDQILYDSGQISGLEFEEAKNNSANVKKEYTESNLILISRMSQLGLWEVDPKNIDVETWLCSLEKELSLDIQRSAIEWELNAQKYDLEKNLSKIIEEEASSLPVLSVSFAVNPSISNQGKPDMWDAVFDFWNKELSLGGSLSATISIPILPWDPIWKSKGIRDSKRRLLRGNITSIERQLENILLSRSKLIDHHNLAVSQAERTIFLEKDRLDLYRIKESKGNLTEIELILQEIQVEISKLDWYSARIDRISTMLKGE